MNYYDKMKRAFMRRVEHVSVLSNRAQGFVRKLKQKRKRSARMRRNVWNRMHRHCHISKRASRLKFRGSPIIRIKSMIWLKRNFCENHVRARLYKRVFRGIAGAYSWKTLDRIFPRPKVAKAARRKVIAEMPSAVEIPKKGFFSKLADKFKSKMRFPRLQGS